MYTVADLSQLGKMHNLGTIKLVELELISSHAVRYGVASL